MQLHLVLRGHDIALPIAYRHTLQGLIYRAFSADAAFSSSLHDGGYMAQDRAFKLFTFGPLTGNYTVKGKRIVFHNDVRLEIRAAKPDMIHLLSRTFREGEAVALGRNAALITKSRVEDFRVKAETAVVTTLSPVVAYQTLEDGHTRFLSPADEGFFAAVARNAQRKWESLYGLDAPFMLEVAPVSGYAGRKVVTSFKETYITAWNGRFVLRGRPEALDFLYQVGLGAKSSQGFGMFRVEHEGTE